jgi:hypothetical protein
MGLATYPFSGRMDLDSPTLVVPQGSHVMARNGIFRGVEGRMRFESCLGTNLIAGLTLPAGTNCTVGVKYDPVNENTNETSNPRVLFANYNSNGNSGWYIYYTLTQTFHTLVEDGVNTVGQVTGITSAQRITSIDLLYGDGVQGTLLFYVDSNQTCRKLNINRILAGGYPTIKNTYLNVVKAPPIPPIQCCYENDIFAPANNLVNSLFNFTCTHIYDDFEQSVLASASKQPLPSDPFNPNNTATSSVATPFRNARIVLYIPTGDINVTKLRIYAKQTQYGSTTDWFIVDTLDKTLLNIPSNTVYQYYFYNNGNYTAADPSFTVLDYDQVPIYANCQSLLDGNVISYAGITEGYNFINPTFSVATSNVNFPQYSINGLLFFAATNGVFSSGQPQITVYLRGVGSNDGYNNPILLEKVPKTLTVRAKSGATDISFTFNNTTGVVNSILVGLLAAANAAGWVTVGSVTTNSFTIYYPTGNVVLQSSYVNGVYIDNSPYPSPICCHFPQSTYSYGVLYRDGDGRTNGAISNVTGNLVTQAASAGQIPQVSINLAAFQPPPWAVYWELVRTDTLTYNKYLNWVTNAACQGTGAGVSTQYAYFGINNIATYNTSINATEGPVSYSFTQGDRIKILGRYDHNMNFYPLNLDYAILGEATNPIANGIFQTGTFIQIYYPTYDVGANPNFGFPIVSNDDDFQNYLVLIYSYKPYSTTNQNVYFQVGQQYGIGNPGTGTAYHMGNVADNQVVTTDGDVFNRQRPVPLINSYPINTGSFDQTSPYGTDWVNPGGGAVPIVDNGIWKIVGGVQQVAGLLNTQYPTYADNDMTILNESTTLTLAVRLRGTQTIIDKTDPNGQFSKYVKVVLPGNVVTTTQIVPTQSGINPQNSSNSSAVTVTFDATIQLPPQGKLWLINYCVNEMLIGGYLLQLDVLRTITINAFDASFSDIYELATNSDNEPTVVNVEAAQTYYSTLFRFSQPDILGTDINNSNRFYPENFDEWDKSFGDVIRMRVRQRELRVFQKRRTGRVGVYQKFITNQSASVSLVVSDTIITQNNIQYFEGEFGIGNAADSLCSSGYQDYFNDPIKGCFCRVSLNGVDNISEDEKVQTFAGNTTPLYLNTYAYPFGGTSAIIGAFNVPKDRDAEVLFFMQPGTSGANTLTDQTIAFNERQKVSYGFYDYAPDAAVCAENQLILFYNGQLYIQNNSTTYANFFGTQQTPSITMVFKDPNIEKKTFESVTEVANALWVCPQITTDTYSYPGTLQSSNLVAEDFELLGTDWNAPFWFDANSQQGQFNGDPLQATELIIEFASANPSQFSYLAAVGIRYIDSPLTVK